MQVPKEAQIQAILSAGEWQLAKEYGLSDSEITWTVTREDVKNYVNTNGFPTGWVHLSEGTHDGVYLLGEDANWTVSYKERGVIYYEERFESPDEAMDYLLDEYYLKRHGIV